ncbi:PA2778 family cysteine peptidase [Metapseudomonas furukawaii]|uniref:PA2778 family cysteine peptidase n=1 Tax=Metapseudomonas furukawaii TaxID=1149133 RepID=UPI00227A3764|nr:PA2778 family cysteine peptidase [Pseudomonas furukawaii]WAG78145.1 PA2778 family cysteine peptidase [Pseudomonas furukawaii]
MHQLMRGGWALLVLFLAGCAGQQTQLPPESARLPERVELADTPFYPQEIYQCGPAALATLLVQRGVQTSPEALAPKVYLPGREGSLKMELVAAARQNGMLVYPVEPELDALLAQVAAGNPVLVMQNLGLDWLPRWHFAVVVGYDRAKGEVVLRSGTEKRWVTDLRSFDRTWQRAERWGVVTLPPERLPAEARLEPWISAASDLEQTAQRKVAERAYQTAAEHWPKAPLPLFALANARYAEGDREGAERALRESLRRKPDYALGWFNLSEVLNERGCATQAAQARACARKLAPDDARLSAPLGAAAKAGRCEAVPVCGEGARAGQ